MAWATVDDTYVLTGAVVSPEQVEQAQGVVELYAGLSTAADEALGVRDRRLLRSAVAYQAAFIAGQPGVFTRAGLASLTQDGVTVNTGSDPDALLISPLTRRCLKGVSWRGARSIRMNGVGFHERAWFVELTDRWFRDEVAGPGGWRPLP